MGMNSVFKTQKERKISIMNRSSAVQFSGESRIHIGLNVSDLNASQRFYQTLFNTTPSKERPGYAKFEPSEPSVNLTLNQLPSSATAQAHTGHYGVQVQSTDAVQEAIDRFKAEGLATRVQENTTCCYAVQDKVWVDDPDGNEWEVFVVLEADAEQHSDETECCTATPTTEDSKSCC